MTQDECVLDSGQLYHCIHAQRIIKEHANENAPCLLDGSH